MTETPDPPGDAGRRARRVAVVVVLAALVAVGIAIRSHSGSSGSSAADRTLTPGAVFGGGTAPPSSRPSIPAPSRTVVTAMPTPLAPASFTIPSPTVPTSTPRPGALRASTLDLDLGTGTTPHEFRLTNTGGRPVSYLLALSTNAISATPATHILDPGRSVTVKVSADRSRLPEGEAHETIAVTWNGGRTDVQVSVRTEIPPTVGLPRLGSSTCAPGGRTVTVTVAAADTSGLASVRLVWEGSASGSTAMTSSPSTWTAQLGPFATAGNLTVHAVARDSRGNVKTGSSRSISVAPCPQ